MLDVTIIFNLIREYLSVMFCESGEIVQFYVIWNKSEIDEVNMIKSLVVTAVEVMREFGVKVTVKIASSIFSWRESAVVVIQIQNM